MKKALKTIPFTPEKYKDVVELWIYDPKRKDLRDELLVDIDIKTVGSELKNDPNLKLLRRNPHRNALQMPLSYCLSVYLC